MSTKNTKNISGDEVAPVRVVEKNNDLNIPYDIYEDMIVGIKKSGNVIRPNELYNAIRDATKHNGSLVLAKFYDLEVELIDRILAAPEGN